MTALWTYLALRDDYPDDGTCVAWVESRGQRCEKPAVERLCKRHTTVAERVKARRDAKDRAQQERRDQLVIDALPANRERLERIEKRIAHLDPPPPTTDPAAWSGVGHRGERVYRRKFTPERIHELAELHKERERVALEVRLGEAALKRLEAQR